LAEAIIDGKLKPKEAEKAKEAIMSGASVEEAIKLAKTAKLEEEEEAAPIEAPPTIQPTIQPTTQPTIQPPAPPAPERITAKPLATTNLQEITCPKCGAKAEINWTRREIIWQ
jgi:DNA-directed RNA polymerase subunit M/transcription elongation factor TFIIS